MEIRRSSQDTERNVLCWGLMVWRLKAHIVNKLDRENNCLDRRNPSCGSDSGPRSRRGAALFNRAHVVPYFLDIGPKRIRHEKRRAPTELQRRPVDDVWGI